jgi:peptidoglycan L-alanyl-D-glutamate endopeptidase CwlK
MARGLIQSAEAAGVELLVTSTLRTFEEQAELFAQGRTKPGKIVTKAKPGESWHNFGLAFDVVPLIAGKAVWDSPRWTEIGALGKAIGLAWGGDFKSFKDLPHFEFHPELTIKQANQRRAEGTPLLT